jgi:CheY-like chemotaxis protein
MKSSSTITEVNNNNKRGRKNRILVVDDEPDVTLTLKIGLETNGYIVDAVNDPLEGLLYFENSKNRYDFLILDIRMPGMNGFEFYKRIHQYNIANTTTTKSIVGIRRTRVCFLTALSIEDCEIVQEGLASISASSAPSPLGSNSEENGRIHDTPIVITKPVSIPILCRLIDEVLSDSGSTAVKIKQNGQLQEPPKCNSCGALMDSIQSLSGGRKILVEEKMYFCNNPQCAPTTFDAEEAI